MTLFNCFNKANINRVANINSAKFTQKKLALSSYVSHKLASTPDILFPMEVDKNQPPSLKT